MLTLQRGGWPGEDRLGAAVMPLDAKFGIPHASRGLSSKIVADNSNLDRIYWVYNDHLCVRRLSKHVQYTSTI